MGKAPPGRTHGAAAAAALAAGWLLAAPLHGQESAREAREQAESRRAPDAFAAPLEKRLRGAEKPDDFDVDVIWPYRGKVTSCWVFGDGVALWNRDTQFRLSRQQVVAVMRLVRRARFGAMSPRIGGEGEKEKQNDARPEEPPARGRVSVSLAGMTRAVRQREEGESAEALKELAESVLRLCEPASKTGIAVASLSEGLQKLADGTLAPQGFELLVHRDVDPADASSGEASWLLRVAGRRVTDRVQPKARGPFSFREMTLTAAEFAQIIELLRAANVAAIPQSVWAPQYTTVRVQVLGRLRMIMARRFTGMSPETHGEQQKSFDRIAEAMEGFHRRARAEGREPAADGVPAAAASDREKERKPGGD